MKTISHILALGLVVLLRSLCIASDKPVSPPEKFFRLIDLFDLETASDPQISPDGTKVVFVRNFNDIMKDKKRSNLWIVDFDGNDLRPLTTGNANDFSPRWSPDGRRLLYASSAEGSVQIFVRWLDTGQTAKVTSVQKSPTSMTWSPDGSERKGPDQSPAVSPDGKFIAYTGFDDKEQGYHTGQKLVVRRGPGDHWFPG